MDMIVPDWRERRNDPINGLADYVYSQLGTGWDSWSCKEVLTWETRTRQVEKRIYANVVNDEFTIEMVDEQYRYPLTCTLYFYKSDLLPDLYTVTESDLNQMAQDIEAGMEVQPLLSFPDYDPELFKSGHGVHVANRPTEIMVVVLDG